VERKNAVKKGSETMKTDVKEREREQQADGEVDILI